MFDSIFAKVAVITVLLGSDTQKLKPFGFGAVGFDPKTFPILAGYFKNDKISVEYDSGKTGMAEYDYGSNTLFVGFTSASTLSRKALIIHECTHALYDVVSQKMNVATSEAIAYIVQCQYARANNADPTIRLTSPNAAKDKVFEVAWDIAGKVLEGNNPSADDKANILAAVSNHPYYAKNASSDAGFNGV